MESIDGGATVVTASARLARHLQFQYAGARMAAGATAWETPDILPLWAWIQRTWSEIGARGDDAPYLMSAAQQSYTWEQIIRRSPAGGRLLQPAAVARQALAAWRLLREWDQPAFPGDNYLSEDARAFRSWAREFEQRCAEPNWIDPASLPAALAHALAHGPARPQRPLAWVGFEILSPAQSALVDALRAGGWTVDLLAPPQRNRERQLAAFTDFHAELTATAAWARAILEHSPDATVGIVLPDLFEHRSLVEDCLEDVLQPGSILNAAGGDPRLFSIAAGTPLSDYPLVRTALSILELARGVVPLERIGRLLRSPFLGGATQEQLARAGLEARLFRHGDRYPGLQGLLRTARRWQSDRGGVALLVAGLERFVHGLAAAPAERTALQWARGFARLLSDMGWPGERPLSSAEFQCLDAWNDVLARLASLDDIAPAMPLPAALGHLERLCAEQDFQPQTGETPVQVLGPAGAADMAFSHLRFINLHDGAWPRRLDPNPFIPLKLQRDLGMPGASAEIASEHARGITRRLCDSATHAVLSYPCNDGDRPLRPSPLLRGLDADAAATATPTQPGGYTVQLFEARAGETFEDQQAPPLAAAAVPGGGSAVFRDQAACPFRACARHRLHARAIDSIDIGLDPMGRGTVVHAVLQRVWQRLRDHAGLAGMPAAERDALVAAAIDEVIRAARARNPGTWTRRFAELEAARLARLVTEWLSVEVRREPFEVVATEEKQARSFAGLELNLRIDRIDRLRDGRLVILDYKTGRASTGAWFGDRPEEPQLPLYAVTAGGDLAALAFARVRRGECGFTGIADSDQRLPEVPGAGGGEDAGNLDMLMDDWRTTLAALAHDFRDGRAAVQPRDARACQLCDLHVLCRIHELAAEPVEDDDG